LGDADVERGNWQTVLPNESLLQNYVLWPDLRALYLKANIANADRTEVDSFLDQYGTLKPARELRYRFALQLVKEGQLGRFLKIYQQFYQVLGIASLDCLALQAEIEADQIQRVISRAIDLWNVSKSQAEECDVVFDQLRDQNLLTRNHYESRFALAIEAKQFSLARYLARALEPRFMQIAKE
jgi:soluble lytic murein transglycosylase